MILSFTFKFEILFVLIFLRGAKLPTRPLKVRIPLEIKARSAFPSTVDEKVISAALPPVVTSVASFKLTAERKLIEPPLVATTLPSILINCPARNVTDPEVVFNETVPPALGEISILLVPP